MLFKSTLALNSSEKRKNILTAKTDTSAKRIFNSPNPRESKKVNEPLSKKHQTKGKYFQYSTKQSKPQSQVKQFTNLAKKGCQDQGLFDDYKQIIQSQRYGKQISQVNNQMVTVNTKLQCKKKEQYTNQGHYQEFNSRNHPFSQANDKITKPKRLNQILSNSPSDPKDKKPTVLKRENKYKSQALLVSKIIQVCSQSEAQNNNDQSLVLQAKNMISSDFSNSIKEGNLRKCLSVELKPKQQKKMKLRDYLYINSISGIRKKVIIDKKEQVPSRYPSRPYIRVRQFANDEIIQNKIKSEIEANIAQIMSKLSAFERMGDFKGDKLILNNLSNIIKEKIIKGCNQMEQLMNSYQQKLD